PLEDRAVVGRVGARLDEFQTERLGLRPDQLAPYTVEPDEAGHAFVDVEEVADIQPHADRAVEREHRVLAAAPAEGVHHAPSSSAAPPIANTVAAPSPRSRRPPRPTRRPPRACRTRRGPPRFRSRPDRLPSP